MLLTHAPRYPKPEPAYEVQPVLEALGDADCRTILGAIGDDALTASECAATTDLALSTTYRKLDRLADAGLLEEELRIRRDGKHASEYRRVAESVCVSIDDGGAFSLSVTPTDGV